MAESPQPGSDPANDRVEIDTSTPFESVREAANRFGGFGFWRPSHSYKPPRAFQVQENVEGEIMALKTHAAELQNDLILKEREKLEVVKELEETKAIVKELNLKLQHKEELREEVHGYIKPTSVVLKELSKAKMSLCKRTVDLEGIRKSVEGLNKKLKEEKDALEKTRERLMFDRKGETGETEVQRFKKTGDNARAEIVKAMAEIEGTREKIETVKIRLVAARKMKEAVERVDTANATKLEAEESLNIRSSQSEKGPRRRLSSSVNNTAKFKSRRETKATTTTRILDVNGLHLTYDDVVVGSLSSAPDLKPTMSIGQILSKKLLVAEDSDMMNKKMSLGQILAKSSNDDETHSKKSGEKEKKRFAKIAMLLNKESKNKNKTKKIALNLR